MRETPTQTRERDYVAEPLFLTLQRFVGVLRALQLFLQRSVSVFTG
jgi:hypothetical protein